MKFTTVLEKLIDGECDGIRLPQWEEDVEIRIQRPDEHSKMTHPYLYVESRYGNVPWRETFPEMFSDSWELVFVNTKLTKE